MMLVALMGIAPLMGADTKVKNVQEMLTTQGYYHGPVDGKNSDATKTAVKEFQKAQGLPETGKIDTKTLGRLSSTTESGAERSADPKSSTAAKGKGEADSVDGTVKAAGSTTKQAADSLGGTMKDAGSSVKDAFGDVGTLFGKKKTTDPAAPATKNPDTPATK